MLWVDYRNEALNMSFGVMMQQICVIILEILLGAAGAKLGIIRDGDSKFLSRLTTTFLLPCTILASSSMEGGREVVGKMFLCIGIILVLYIASSGVCLVLGKQMKLTRGQTAVLVGTAPMPNCGFIGIPMAVSLMGQQMGMLCASAGVVAYNLWFFTYITSLFQKERKMHIRELITPVNMATLVLIICLLLGIRMPTPVQTFLSSVGGCTTPVALMIVGVMLANSDIKGMAVKPFLYLITALKGIVFPLVFMVLLLPFHLDPVLCFGMCIVAACPSGNMAAVVAKQNGVEESLCGQAVAHSTLFMLITMPLIMALAARWFPM